MLNHYAVVYSLSPVNHKGLYILGPQPIPFWGIETRLNLFYNQFL